MSTEAPATAELPDNPMYRAMRSGHQNRLGHELDAFLRMQANGLWETVKRCCGET